MPDNYIEITLEGDVRRSDEASAFLIAAGSSGVVEEAGEEVGTGGKARLTGHLAGDGAERVCEALSLVMRRIGWSLRWGPYEGGDWRELWKRWARAVAVGGVFIIRPTWVRKKAAGRIVIEIDPGMAFGTGSHETTKLCLRALSALYGKGRRSLKGRSVLDVGTGTGVLAIGASKLGAAKVVAIDTDPVALKVARKNVKLNGGGVTVSSKLLEGVSGVFSVVIANIISGELMRLSEELTRRVAPGGRLVLSGILVGEGPGIVEVFTATGELRSVKTLREGEWAAPVFEKVVGEKR